MLRLDVRQRSQALRCTYCFDSLPEEGVHACGGCGTILHGECAAELAACPTIGCGRALRVEALDLSSLSEALDLAERTLQSALHGGDFRARRRAQENYSAARRAYRQRDREQLELGYSPTQPLHRSEPPRVTPAPVPASFWEFHEGWKLYLWATALPSIMSAHYLLSQLPFKLTLTSLLVLALFLWVGSLCAARELCRLAARACRRLWERCREWKRRI